MALLGPGVYQSPYGSGNQSVTVGLATVAGDLLMAIYCSQVTSGVVPAWTVPAGWTVADLPDASSDNYPVGLESNFLGLGFFQPGAQPANTVYTFNHGLSGRTLIVLFRASQALANTLASLAKNSGNKGNAGPTSVAVTFPAAQPGFDVYIHGGIGDVGFTYQPKLPTGDNNSWIPVAILANASDSINLGIYVQTKVRPGAFTGTIQAAFTPTPNGWAAKSCIVQLGVSNTPTTLSDPGGIPVGFGSFGLFPRRSTRANPAGFSSQGPTIARRHFQS